MRYSEKPKARLERDGGLIRFYDERGIQVGNGYDLKDTDRLYSAGQALACAREAGFLTKGRYSQFIRKLGDYGLRLTNPVCMDNPMSYWLNKLMLSRKEGIITEAMGQLRKQKRTLDSIVKR